MQRYNTNMKELSSNIFDCALIFEGGGMRASYTAAIVNKLLEEGIYFDHVYGVSAGASNTVNYLSRDLYRTFESFTTFALDPKFGGVRSFLEGNGTFNAQYIYMESAREGGALPFDMETYLANPATCTICAIERDTGKTRLFTKDQMIQMEDLMKGVRASSTLPLVMPPIQVDGQVLYDGGLAEGNGLMIPQAMADGFKKFFIVRTRPKGFRKPEHPGKAILAFFARYPYMHQALLDWGPGYNAMCDLAEQLEEEGRALVVYAENQLCENYTKDITTLLDNYELGAKQADRDFPKWKEFLGL